MYVNKLQKKLKKKNNYQLSYLLLYIRLEQGQVNFERLRNKWQTVQIA